VNSFQEMFSSVLYVDEMFIFYLLIKDDFKTEFQAGTVTPMVASVFLKTSTVTDKVLDDNSYKIHSQAVLVKNRKFPSEKDKFCF